MIIKRMIERMMKDRMNEMRKVKERRNMWRLKGIESTEEGSGDKRRWLEMVCFALVVVRDPKRALVPTVSLARCLLTTESAIVTGSLRKSKPQRLTKRRVKSERKHQ